MSPRRRRGDLSDADWGLGDAPETDGGDGAGRAVPARLPPPAPEGPLLPARLAESAQEYAGHRYAPNTRRSYEGDWRRFEEWCRRYGCSPFPRPAANEQQQKLETATMAKTIASFLLDLADGVTSFTDKKGRDQPASPKRPSTIERHLATIATAHKRAGHPSPWDHPLVKDVLVSIRNKKGTAPSPKKALLAVDVARAVDAIPVEGGARLRGLRDRAMILLGFEGAFRREELLALDREHVQFMESPHRGIVARVARSKTDQAGRGRDAWIPASSGAHCPVEALRAWIAAAGIESGPLFRAIRGDAALQATRLSDDAYVHAIKRAVGRIGLDAKDYAGHSLRAGWATTADRRGMTLPQIMMRTGHRSTQTVLRYVRDRDFYGPNMLDDQRGEEAK